MAVQFFYENVEFDINKEIVKKWVDLTVRNENYDIGDINIIFTDDNTILSINHNYLQREYPTDIISFNLSESDTVCGDVFISVDTVQHNATQYQVSTTDELMRVIIHGILHLMGYRDYTDQEKTFMRKKEDEYLTKLNHIRPTSSI